LYEKELYGHKNISIHDEHKEKSAQLLSPGFSSTSQITRRKQSACHKPNIPQENKQKHQQH
jgi:hypothetical protein